MNPAISASQFRSRYKYAVAASSASVKPIFINSQKKNVRGLAPPAFVDANKRNAMIPFGTTQQSPPSTAENIAALPPNSAARTPATIVAINCRETRRNIFILLPWSLEPSYGVVIT